MLEPFEFGFMQRAMVTAALVGGITAAIGVFVVLRHLAYIGHGLAHSIFGGAVISFVSGINFFIGASIWGAASVVLINLVSRRPQIGGDAAIGIITTAAFADRHRGDQPRTHLHARFRGRALRRNPRHLRSRTSGSPSAWSC